MAGAGRVFRDVQHTPSDGQLSRCRTSGRRPRHGGRHPARREREAREVVQESRRRARAVIAGARQEQERVSPDERSSDSSRAENPGVIIYIQYKYRPLCNYIYSVQV